MAGSVNKIIIVGNLGNDPEVKSLDNGDEVVNMSIATSETWKDKQSGERRERTEWHRVAIFNPGLVTAAKNYLKKGSKVSIEGQLETCKWQDQNGQDRYSTEVVLRPFRSELTMLDSKGGGAPAACRSQTAGATGKVDDEIRFNPSRRGPCGRGERLASAPVLSRKHE